MSQSLAKLRRRRKPVRAAAGPGSLPAFKILQRNRWQIFAAFFTRPPGAGRTVFLRRCKMVLEQFRANVLRRSVGKRISRKERRHVRRIVEQTLEQADEPWILPVSSQRGEPHLPIESRLMRFAALGTYRQN